jgi:hypothetical protein
VKQLTWDEQALATAGIRPDQLSESVPATHMLRGLKPRYVEALGLDPETSDAQVTQLEQAGQPYSFGTLKAAQTLGDFQVLRAHGRRVVRIQLGRSFAKGLQALTAAVEDAV